ncbi:SDR family NAD(P)-dependent oxidoreductase [Thauera aminoaromatica]|uniref:SDR family NAD(P)-dependent oxidoreductase n=1 Tax=Thauera aminoaromatica TaxID=164330 RepID=A0A5C7T9T9_THASP|nr:SDR family NAD(P)-dependent oxidoreductase [Thauera aminoaromatica]TXH92440.1 MAG: SDR family NAD(P)-dependent oxidoreductase [Thauera aminoaromatica]
MTAPAARRGGFAPLNTPIREWAGRRVWIVGASSGIGEALALALARRGARLALSARGRERLEAVCAACDAAAGAGPTAGDAGALANAAVEPAHRAESPAPAGVLALALDLSRAGEIERARDRLLAAWGGIDLVVFNAGTYRPLRAWELTAEAVRETLETNLVGTMSGTAAVLPTLLAQGHGAIALVGSVAGYGGLPKALVYGPSKAALINFAEVLHLDLSPRGIGVFLIDPGFVATPLTAQNDFAMPALQTPEQAAAAIVDGFARGDFEIHFPKRFTRALKLLQLLPRPLYFALIRRATGL